MAVKCKLCQGTGDNCTGIAMKVNNHICPRCGGYGTVPDTHGNKSDLTAADENFIDSNGRVTDEASLQ